MKALGILVLLIGSVSFAKSVTLSEKKQQVIQAVQSLNLKCRDQHNAYYDASFVISKIAEATQGIQNGSDIVFINAISDIRNEKTTVKVVNEKVATVEFNTLNLQSIWPKGTGWVVEDSIVCK